ncbi:MAG: hypothetical protein ACI8P2_001022 [Candidatus Latescibacterota bacterium]
MYEKLSDVELKGGERVELGCVRGPDLDWAERIESLLLHKGPLWNWQNTAVLRRGLGMDVVFYVLHRDGIPLANMMTVEHRGVGHFGHVWTQPEDRRKGAASLIMDAQMADFKRRGGQALFLGTGYNSAPYHIYAARGFVGLEAESGYMAYYARDSESFYADYYAPGPVEIRDLSWCDWPASAALFLADFPGVVRCPSIGLLARSSTEGPFLQLLQEVEKRREEGADERVRVLVSTQTGAVAGLALWNWDAQWPRTCQIDLYCHPQYWIEAGALLDSLPLPAAERYVTYADMLCIESGQVLAAAGFTRGATHHQRAAIDHARRQLVDIEVWETRSVDFGAC